MNVIISKQYTVNVKLYEDAFRTFQKKFVYPKNILLSVAYVAFAVFNVVCFINDGSNIRILFAAAFAGIAISLWTGAKSVRRKFLNAVSTSGEQDIYKLDVLEDRFRISTITEQVKSDDDDFFSGSDVNQPEPTEINFDNPSLRIVEKEKFFMLYLVRSVFFVVPKNAFSAEELTLLADTLRNVPNKRFCR